MPRYYFDIFVRRGHIERDATGVVTPDVGTALHGCIAAVLEMIEADEVDLERVIVKDEDGEVLMSINAKALLNSAQPQGG